MSDKVECGITGTNTLPVGWCGPHNMPFFACQRIANEARIHELESALRSALAGVSAMRFATRDLKTLEGLREMERFLNEKAALAP